MLILTKLIFLGISLVIICLAIFADVWIDGTLSPSWNSLLFVGGLISAIALIKDTAKSF
jgi:hypothetical protein